MRTFSPIFHDDRLGVAVEIVQLIARKYEIGAEMDSAISDYGLRAMEARLLEELNQFLVPAGYKGYQDFWNTVEFRTSPKWARNNLPDVEDVYHEDEFFNHSIFGRTANL